MPKKNPNSFRHEVADSSFPISILLATAMGVQSSSTLLRERTTKKMAVNDSVLMLLEQTNEITCRKRGHDTALNPNEKLPNNQAKSNAMNEAAYTIRRKAGINTTDKKLNPTTKLDSMCAMDVQPSSTLLRERTTMKMAVNDSVLMLLEQTKEITCRKRGHDTALNPNEKLPNNQAKSKAMNEAAHNLRRRAGINTTDKKLHPTTKLDSMCAIFLSTNFKSQLSMSRPHGDEKTRRNRGQNDIATCNHISKKKPAQKKPRENVAMDKSKRARSVSVLQDALHTAYLNGASLGPKIPNEKEASQKITSNLLQNPCRDKEEDSDIENITPRRNLIIQKQRTATPATMLNCHEVSSHDEELLLNSSSVHTREQKKHNIIRGSIIDIIPPRRSQRTRKPANRLTVNWETTASKLPVTKTHGDHLEGTSIMSKITDDRTLLYTKQGNSASVRKSCRKLKNVEHLVVIWNNDQQYYSRSLVKSANLVNEINAASGRVRLTPSTRQVRSHKNLVKNLDMDLFQMADANNIPSKALHLIPKKISMGQENTSQVKKNSKASCQSLQAANLDNYTEQSETATKTCGDYLEAAVFMLTSKTEDTTLLHSKQGNSASARKSCRKLKKVEHLVVAWDNDQRYYSRFSAESNNRNINEINAASRGDRLTPSKQQVRSHKNLVKNLDIDLFHKADTNNIPSKSLHLIPKQISTGQEYTSQVKKNSKAWCQSLQATNLDNYTEQSEILQRYVLQQRLEEAVRSNISPQNPSSSKNENKQRAMDTALFSAPRKSSRKTQPTNRWTATWTKEHRVSNTRNMPAEYARNSLDEIVNINEEKNSMYNVSDKNFRTCLEKTAASSNNCSITSKSFSAQKLTEQETVSEATNIARTSCKSSDTSMVEHCMKQIKILQECGSQHLQEERLTNKCSSLRYTSSRVKMKKQVNIMDTAPASSARRSRRKPQPTDRLTVTWTKEQMASNSRKLIAGHAGNSSDESVSSFGVNNATSSKDGKSEHIQESKCSYPNGIQTNNLSTENSDVVNVENKTKMKKNTASSVLVLTKNKKFTLASASDENWTEEEVSLLWTVVMSGVDPTTSNFWECVADQIQSKDAAECRKRWFAIVPPCNKNGRSKSKRTRNEKVLVDAPCVNKYDVDDIFNSTPMMDTHSAAAARKCLPQQHVLPQLADFNSPIICSPVVQMNKNGSRPMCSPEDSARTFMSRRSPILEKKGYKGYIKTLAQQSKLIAKKKKQKQKKEAQSSNGVLQLQKSKASSFPLRASMDDGNIEMSATLNDCNLEVCGPTDSDLEDLGIDPNVSEDEFKNELDD